EKIIVPMLDILQSIPVLGFLPGLMLGLVALFPRTNTGLELTAIISIFTGQVWNMTFAFYSSLKSVPMDFQEASTVIGMSWWRRLIKVELPFSAVNLAWNSLMSMAGGWFFLAVCEAFTLGDREFRLPGIGAYMDVAIKRGDTQAIWLGVGAMVFLIVAMDFFIWRPILFWVQRFRLEEIPGAAPEEPLMQVVLRNSWLVRWATVIWRRSTFYYWMSTRESRKRESEPIPLALAPASLQRAIRKLRVPKNSRRLTRGLEIAAGLALLSIVTWACVKLLRVLAVLPPSSWFILIRDTFWTFTRVLISLGISTLWAVPVGIWIGTSSRRVRIAQPIIQVLASFPAPMLYPIVLGVLFFLHINFEWGSMFLMLLGVQWYVLFNVLAGALRIPRELSYALSLMEASRWTKWKTLYLPSVFPALVTGWVTAAGGAWNASIVAEYIAYKGTILKTGGLGATIHAATDSENMPLFAAGLTVMVLIVVIFNRVVWAKVYHLAETRYRMDLS
ncbi:MAG: ABC transporter permease subunit, partial [Bdellovibrionota bacterium]